MVASRHAQTGMVKPTKPCMMTYPAIVPTAAPDLQGLDVHPTVFVLTELVS